MVWFSRTMREVLTGADIASSFESAKFVGRLFGMLMLWGITLAIVAALATLVQTGGVFTLHPLVPRWERLDLAAGWRHLMRLERVWAVARALMSMAAIGVIAVLVMREHRDDIRFTASVPTWAPRVATGLVLRVLRLAAIVFVVAGILDAVVKRRSWRHRLRMTREEWQRELREAEGDPEVKDTRRRMHREEVMGAGDLRDATVVIRGEHLAFALRYHDGDEAPMVWARGEGLAAERIIRRAEIEGVPVFEDNVLAVAMRHMGENTRITANLYDDVARVMRAVSEGTRY